MSRFDTQSTLEDFTYTKIVELALFLYTVSQKTVPTDILLLVCHICTDFNKNWKNCPEINPQQNCT